MEEKSNEKWIQSLDSAADGPSTQSSTDDPTQGQLSADNPIQINVGGRLFTSTRTTLQRSPLLKAILPDGPKYEIAFLDRNPDLFELILNGLRGGSRVSPTGQKYIQWRHELEYFGLIDAPKTAADRDWIYHKTNCLLVKGVDGKLYLFGYNIPLWEDGCWGDIAPSQMKPVSCSAGACQMMVNFLLDHGFIIQERKINEDGRFWTVELVRI